MGMLFECGFRIRLLAGFHFAHSHSGIVNMVLEVYMMASDFYCKLIYNFKLTNSSCQVCFFIFLQQDDSAAGNDKDFERFPCMIQYVIFPPHSTTNLSER